MEKEVEEYQRGNIIDKDMERSYYHSHGKSEDAGNDDQQLNMNPKDIEKAEREREQLKQEKMKRISVRNLNR